MHHFIRNDTHVVIPGFDKNAAGVFKVTPEFYETPYGLVFPSTVLATSTIRFLRNFKSEDPDAYKWAPLEFRYLVVYLLNNVGNFEMVTFDCENVKDKKYTIVEVTDIPNPTSAWEYVSVLDPVRTMVTTELIADMTKDEAVKWLDENSGQRFQSPILISLENWRQYRKEKELDTLFLQNSVIARPA